MQIVIRVSTLRDAIEVQEAVFKLGGRWNDGTIRVLKEPFKDTAEKFGSTYIHIISHSDENILRMSYGPKGRKTLVILVDMFRFIVKHGWPREIDIIQ